MFRDSFNRMHPITKLIFVGLSVTIIFLGLFLFALFAAIPIFDISLENLDIFTNSSDPSNMPFIKYLQIIQGFALFIIPSIFIAFFFRKNIFEYFMLNKKLSVQSVIIIIATGIFVLPFINYTALLNSQLDLPSAFDGIERWMISTEENATKLTERFLKMDNVEDLLINLFMIALIPAIGEELLFRGILQRIFTEWTKNHHIGIMIAAIIFSAFHLQFLGFVPRLILGIIFGYYLVWSKSLWLPIIAHFINNGFAVISYYFIQQGALNKNIETIGAKEGLTLAIPSLIITVVLLYSLFKFENRKDAQIQKIAE